MDVEVGVAGTRGGAEEGRRAMGEGVDTSSGFADWGRLCSNIGSRRALSNEDARCNMVKQGAGSVLKRIRTIAGQAGG